MSAKESVKRYSMAPDGTHESEDGRVLLEDAVEARDYDALQRERDALKERVRKLEAAILGEPEFPGPMPDEMWERVHNDRDACQEALRLAVRLTKQGILARAALQAAEGER